MVQLHQGSRELGDHVLPKNDGSPGIETGCNNPVASEVSAVTAILKLSRAT